MSEIEKTEEEWRNMLSDEQFRITRQCGTEPAFTGAYYDHKGNGIYHCICCDAPLFRSDEKFDSGTGWPSFWAPYSDTALKALKDSSHGMVRTEIRCAKCDAHLGHVFPDGPQPSGLRFCINSASLDFKDEG
ncbi:MAG: peptide-methionine (R)-S-oxide reductase MsrB [Gammaproteobacteria bacterium]|nr:peptide-methionine (R)-S-oxide reductase MsrB [Gammaproteobacteria bacterium]